MDTLTYIIENGFNDETLKTIIDETCVQRGFSDHPVIKKQFEECEDLETLKAFSLIMDQHSHIVDVEDKMVDLMGDEYYEFVEGN